eukprot:4845995-Amphidinium_carterae.1
MFKLTSVDGPLSSPFDALRVVSGLGLLSPSFWMMLNWGFFWRQLCGTSLLGLEWCRSHTLNCI